MSEEPQAVEVIRVALADDHDILRQGLKLLLNMQPEIEVVGEARTGGEAIELARDLQPAIIIMDITMPQMDGLEACRRIRRLYPETQVLILTMHESEAYFLEALRAGATGYLVKKAAPADLHSAVKAIANNGAFLYPGLARSLIRAYLGEEPVSSSQPRPERTPSLAQKLRVLTPREIEVLTLVAEGRTNQEIADHLVLSIKTIQAHRANVMEKLGLHDVTHLVRFAIRHRLIQPDS